MTDATWHRGRERDEDRGHEGRRIRIVAGASLVCHSLADAQQFARSLSGHPGNADRR